MNRVSAALLLACAAFLGVAGRPAHALSFDPAWNQVRADDGAVRTLYGRDSAPLDGDGPEAQAREFLRQQAGTLGLPAGTADLTLAGVDSDRLGDHVRFQQTYEGHDVVGGLVSVHLQYDRAYLVSSNYRTVQLLDPNPSLTADAAFGLGARHAGVKSPTADGAPDLVVWRRSNDTTWAWRFPVRDSGRLPYTLLIDAATGRAVRAVPRFETLDAAIYPQNPVRTPVREDRELTGLDASGYLSGPNADVRLNGGVGLRGPTGTRLIHGPDGFRFPPGDGRSIQVNAFYHINRVHDFYKALGVNAVDYPIPVLLRYADPNAQGEAFMNAFYNPTEGKSGILAIGGGPKGEDFSLDSSVLYHEYTHFMVHQINANLLNSQTLETFALNEAIADYGAAAVSGNPAIAEYISPLIVGRPNLRDLTTRRHYPEDTGTTDTKDRHGHYVGFAEGHELGEILSGSLWDLRNVLGAQPALDLFVASLPLLDGASSFPDVRAALITADQKVNAGANGDKIRAIFDARGIGTTAARYLAPDAFSSLREKATVYLGPIIRDGIPADTFITPSEIGATFAVGRTYPFSGFVEDETATSVSLAVADSHGAPIASLAQTQDVTARNDPSSDGVPGRDFSLSLTFPPELAGQTVTLSLTFQLGLRTKWTASTHVDVVAEPGPSVAPMPEPPQPAARALGDADGDGKLTAADAVLALRAVVGLDPAPYNRVLALDVSPAHSDGTIGDDKLNLEDVIQLLKLSVGRLR